jgi:hypothetical protein
MAYILKGPIPTDSFYEVSGTIVEYQERWRFRKEAG